MLVASEQPKMVKVGILGDKLVGKTYLAHKLANIQYQGYSQTTEISELKSQESQEGTKFVYVDNPAVDGLSIVNIGSVHRYDVLVFLFKDCQSFTKLYEFFEAIKQSLKSGVNYHVQHYWQNVKKIIVVYSNFQSDLPVQLQQLFSILTEEIGYFCSGVSFVPFFLEKQSQGWKDLKLLIQKQPVFVDLNQELSDISAGARSSTLQKKQSYQQEVSEKMQERLPMEQELSDERVNLMVEQKSEVIVLSNDLEEIREIQVPVGSDQKSKEVETTTAEIVRQQRKSTELLEQIQSKEANFQAEKHQQIIQITGKYAVETQPAKQAVEGPKEPQVQPRHKQKIEQVRVEQVSFQHQKAEQAKKQEIRRQSIIKKIQDSFFRSSVKAQQTRNSLFHNQDVPQEYIEVEKQDKNEDLLPSFRQSRRKPDPNIDKELNRYNQEKIQKLRHSVQISEDEHIPQKAQEPQQQLKTSEERYKDSPELAVANSKQNEVKGGAKMQFTNKKEPKRQEQLQPEAKCACSIM